MENGEQRPEPALEVPAVREQVEDPRSCFECRHFRWQFGFPHCQPFDKTTSGRVNGCGLYAER